MYKEFYKPQNYVNRELSWIDFNGRVLQEATDTSNPLLERANFLGITQSNVDEFFMVRVASLHKLTAANVTMTDASGMTPEEQLTAVNKKEHEMVKERYEVYNKQIIPDLKQHHIKIMQLADLDDRQKEFIRRYFSDELMPVLTPMADDTSRPFPFIANNSLNIAIQLRRDPKQRKPFRNKKSLKAIRKLRVASLNLTMIVENRILSLRLFVFRLFISDLFVCRERITLF